ncbi:agmatinase [Pseudenhygromyxa sp. WMMC2535]|uniref:agmatinase n=1 Tax=Pseudenhygromyxa sp. WMMC2535 TaxID=2712867 RepID=UPI0015547410|nr:agmatinase [Pseudenhygromyxa sp. WMMC2535]NVB40275.1 agmatinase [Pseudenhygromyxa sp. WMMC2535]
MSSHAQSTRFLESLALDDPRAATAQAAILGVPYDGAVTYRGGASGGPEGLRLASDSIESYCPKLDRDLADHRYVDLGDLDCAVPGPEAGVAGATPGERLVRSLRQQLDALPDLPLVAIGGDHLVAHPFLERALERHPNLQIIHIDAHMDLRAEWEGEPYNHATVLGRIRDRMGPDQRIHQWGIRSGERVEYRLAAEDPRVELLAPTRAAMLERVAALLAGPEVPPIYLTIDVDGIDPADIPGTGTPEPDGLQFGDVEAVLGALARGRRRSEGSEGSEAPAVVGADLVELAPALDPTGRSNVAAARLVRSLLLALM